MKLLLWDIDGTLLSAGGAGGWAMDQAFDDLFGRAPNRANIHFSGLTDYHITEQLLVASEIEATHENVCRALEVYGRYFEECYSRCSAHLYVGVERLLQQIDQRQDCLQGLLTGNIEKAGWAKIERFGLSRYFHFGAFGDNSPERLDLAHDALQKGQQSLPDGVTESAVFVIGDTDNDVRVGQAIGAVTIAVETGLRSLHLLDKVTPDYRLTDLSDTEGFLRILDSAR